MILWILGLSVLSAALYRISGQGGFKNAKMLRRAGIPLLCFLPACFVLFGFKIWLSAVVSAGLLAFALTTYNDYLAPDGSSENWLCWLVTGLFYGLAAVPLIWAGIHWWAIGIRVIVLAGWTVFISEITGNVWVEEIGRGFAIPLSLPILLI